MSRIEVILAGIVAALIIAVGVVAAFAVAGGGGSSGGGQETEGPDLGPRAASELRLPGGDPQTLDPALAGDATSAEYIVHIFGGLVTLDQNLRVVPDLAEELPTRENGGISEDGRTYTFRLRSDAVFHNSNRRVTADDVKYSLERAAREPESPTAYNYLGDIVGVVDVIQGRATEISGIRVLDERTIQITIDAPKPYFLEKLTYPTAFVVDRQQIESDPRGWLRRPNGTGPYRLVEWDLGQKLVLEANDRYHLGAPQVRRVTYVLTGSFTTMYEAGDLDMTGVPADFMERVQDPNDPLSREYVSGDELSVTYVAFNVAQPPFDDPKVRQAFAMSIDKERIAEVVLHGALAPAKGILPPGMPGYSESFRGLPYDPERAKQLLSESRYAGNFPRVVLTVPGAGTAPAESVEAMVNQWNQTLGIQVEIQQVEQTTFFRDLHRRRFQMFVSGWIADYVDPESFLKIKFHS
ncbi:MAG TPA: peptide ABC transporter substrate-binding protein, partial [Dehalococcoidia bacterium]